MNKITKEGLPELVSEALQSAGVQNTRFPELAMRILQSGAIVFPRHGTPPPLEFMEMVVKGRASHSAVHASGAQVNVFVLAAVIMSVVTSAGVAAIVCPIVVGILAACSASLSPKQAAFFVAAGRLKDSGTIPTAAALAAECSSVLPGNPISKEELLLVADELLNLGVPITVGHPPNDVIRHTEWVLTVPGV
jgi:hypothetical protein